MGRRKRRRGKSKGWNPVKHPGSLKKYGYELKDDKDTRHRALGKAYRAYGYNRLVRKLGFLAGAADIPPRLKARAKDDLEWLKEEYGKKLRKKMRRA